MTDFEMLQAILDEIKSVKQEVQEVKQDNKAIRQEIQDIKQDVNTRFNDLEKEVKLNTCALETTVKECIDVLGEGYQANFEKIDRLNLDSMKSKITQLELLYKFCKGEIERLKLKISS